MPKHVTICNMCAVDVQLGFCECQEFDYDYEEGSEDEYGGGGADLVGLGLIDVRTTGITPDGCSEGQGKR